MVGRVIRTQTAKGERPKVVLEMSVEEAQTAQEVLSHVGEDYRADVLSDALCDGLTAAHEEFPELWEEVPTRYIG